MKARNWFLGLALTSMVVPAQATILSVNAVLSNQSAVATIFTPAMVLNSDAANISQQGFDERQGVLLGADIEFDAHAVALDHDFDLTLVAARLDGIVDEVDQRLGKGDGRNEYAFRSAAVSQDTDRSLFVDGAETIADRGRRRRDAAIPGEHDDLRFGCATENRLDGVESRIGTEAKIDDRELYVEVFDCGDRSKIARALHRVATIAKFRC